MRIFSNTLLAWPEILHVFQAARVNLEPWRNYYFYRIKQPDPLIFSTHSPLNLLQTPRQYYCYEQYELNIRMGQFITGSKKTMGTRVYIPVYATVNDVIVIQDD